MDIKKKINFICKKNTFFYFEEYLTNIMFVMNKFKIDNVLYLYDNSNDLIKYIKRNNDINNKNIILTNLEFKMSDVNLQNNIFLLNTEQLSAKNHIACDKDIKNIIIQEPISYADYSLSNIEIIHLMKSDVQSFYLPYQYNPSEMNKIIKKNYKNCNFEYDFAIVSLNTESRKNIYERLMKMGYKITICQGWRKKRDRHINKAKFLLNLHAYDSYTIYEHIRCDRWTFHNKYIISEPCTYVDNLDILNNVFFVDFKQNNNDLKNILDKLLHKKLDNINISDIIKKREQYLKTFVNSI